MAADLVNLRQIRKQRARAEADKVAAANRVAFGTSKSEKARNGVVQRLQQDRFEAHLRSPATPDEP